MKERIYTIPVTEAFREECECPVCVLERKLEDEYVEYVLGPSLMEPEGRIETNENGFCRKHFELLYAKQSKRHGLGLILDTHLTEQNKKLKKMYESKSGALKKDSEISLVKNLSNKISSKQTETEKLVDQLISELSNLENRCAVCNKLNFTLDRYVDVILYLWFKEEDFKALFNSKKGFCLKHTRVLLEGTKKYLNTKEMAIFTENLIKIQLENMERVQSEVNWFTKKFDYRYNDEPWGNSRDAVPRSIQKITGYCDLK
ncbi:MAG: DUF6062 family protein [Clostridia bacterium]|nr:DUF6062 family protein [Clostridia bacterium]